LKWAVAHRHRGQSGGQSFAVAVVGAVLDFWGSASVGRCAVFRGESFRGCETISFQGK